ncbi:hypothetical protein [Brasilonema bromeliae]|uniref:hypothetical protein n=1 Tax=Brasilonema bromeliae TaxID=383615 RepID=UPI001FEA3A29|nr:hypothetical protein [Brasilonema bromeliae]
MTAFRLPWREYASVVFGSRYTRRCATSDRVGVGGARSRARGASVCAAELYRVGA